RVPGSGHVGERSPCYRLGRSASGRFRLPDGFRAVRRWDESALGADGRREVAYVGSGPVAHVHASVSADFDRSDGHVHGRAVHPGVVRLLGAERATEHVRYGRLQEPDHSGADPYGYFPAEAKHVRRRGSDFRRYVGGWYWPYRAYGEWRYRVREQRQRECAVREYPLRE